ncbi:signal recognition particle subunit SRP19/SEC65 family protein [Methanovulcanius yangii]|uniref:signal recognition particle subunit SRP19/SEC65 family protein n=1 Tax=Methanovulcanius yangii TaxID=1789227 RepID=UPI0029CAA64A|nr:signal recognition particle subunit SRP19/SEC65 family protein [Methanovulcanius yangii]
MDPQRILYPCYFDQSLTRSGGRRVPAAMAQENPTAKAIHKAAKRLGLSARIEEAASHPGRWLKKEGRVIVEWKGSKEELIRRVAAKIR